MDRQVSWESWRDLEAARIGYGRLNARRLSVGTALAVDHQGRRHVLLAVAELKDGVTDERSRGLSVTTRELEVEGDPARPFIDVCCTDASNLDVFDIVATALVTDVAAGVAPGDAGRHTMARWRRFWGAGPAEGLSTEEIRGLFGELWFLRLWLLPHAPEMVDHWVGPRGARDDFQWPDLSIEAKATTSIRGHIHRINGLDQLDPPNGGALQLFSLRIRDEPAAANSLVTLIADILGLLATDPGRLDLFEERLASARYSPAHAERYAEVRFRVVSERLYGVTDDFPRLSASSFREGVPRGIERVEYEINLDGFPHLLLATAPGEFTPPARLNEGAAGGSTDE